MKRVSVQMTVSLPPRLYQMAMKLAKKEVRSKSELVREALREYLLKREEVMSARKELSQRLKKRGILKLEDLEPMIDQGRS